jgi:HSP20 family protein
MSQLNVQTVRTMNDRTLPIFAELEQLAERIRMQAYNLFAHRGARDGRALDDWLAAEREVCWPAAELAERESEFVLDVALAGFDAGDITVTATPREIIVKAAHKHEQASKDAPKLRWTEFRSSNVFRRVELPEPVQVEKISANFENGLLKILAPKVQQTESKQIEISTKA